MDNHLPCKPGVAALFRGFISLLDETLSCGLHMTLAVCGMLNSNKHIHHKYLGLLNSLSCLSLNRKESIYDLVRYIEDIYFFEVNTKYISSSELKTSEFS